MKSLKNRINKIRKKRSGSLKKNGVIKGWVWDSVPEQLFYDKKKGKSKNWCRNKED